MELKTQQRYSVTLRDDDVYELTDSTKYFLDLVYPEPLLLAVVPKELDIKLVNYIKQFDNITIAQHGWDHVNRGDKYERATNEQLDLGKLKLQSAFGEKFKNIFVCPWNKYDRKVSGYDQILDDKNTIDFFKENWYNKLLEKTENKYLMTHHTHPNFREEHWFALQILLDDENIEWIGM